MKLVILAGGYGTRLSEETDRIPKPMVQIGGRPILWHIMKLYSHYGINEFVLCLGYKGYVIKEFFSNYFLHNCDVTLDIANQKMDIHHSEAEPWRVSLIDTGQDTMTGGRLKKVANFVKDETFCMTYGDGVGDVDIAKLVAYHTSHGKLATVTAVSPPGRFGMLEMDGDRVSSFREKVEGETGLINGGFFVLEPQVLDYVDDYATIWERAPMERIADEGELQAYRHDGFWQPMDTIRERDLLRDLWDQGKAPWKVW